MATPSPNAPQDEAHVVRFEIPPMMRYCAGTCPCTWVTAIALPNIAYFRKVLASKGLKEDNEVPGLKICTDSVLTGEARQEEAKIVEYMVPAQSLMGLSSYFAWYYGYGFYGPAKYPLLIYGLTLACHSVAHEEDVASNPNMVLAHRAACAAGTTICCCIFLRVSKIASLLMLPISGVYIWLTKITSQGIDGGANNHAREIQSNVNNNIQQPSIVGEDQSNVNNNQRRNTVGNGQQNVNNNQQPSTVGDGQQTTDNLDEEEKSAPKIRHLIQRQLKQQQHPAKRKKDSILKVEDNAKIHTANRLPRHEGGNKSNVSFNRTIGIKYDDNDGESSSSSLRPSSSSSSSSASL